MEERHEGFDISRRIAIEGERLCDSDIVPASQVRDFINSIQDFRSGAISSYEPKLH